MKMLAHRNGKWCRGLATSEYLIIGGIVAIAAIAVVGLFGQQIKDLYYRNTSTLGGTDTTGSLASSITTNAENDAKSTENMNSFDKSKNSGETSDSTTSDSSSPATSTPAPAPSPPQQTQWGCWGGAPSYWFYLALAALAAARKIRARLRVPAARDPAPRPGIS